MNNYRYSWLMRTRSNTTWKRSILTKTNRARNNRQPNVQSRQRDTTAAIKCPVRWGSKWPRLHPGSTHHRTHEIHVQLPLQRSISTAVDSWSRVAVIHPDDTATTRPSSLPLLPVSRPSRLARNVLHHLETLVVVLIGQRSLGYSSQVFVLQTEPRTDKSSLCIFSAASPLYLVAIDILRLCLKTKKGNKYIFEKMKRFWRLSKLLKLWRLRPRRFSKLSRNFKWRTSEYCSQYRRKMGRNSLSYSLLRFSMKWVSKQYQIQSSTCRPADRLTVSIPPWSQESAII